MESKTLIQAKAAHPDAEVIDVIARGPDGRDAIYVWATEEESVDDPGANCEAVYWLIPETMTDLIRKFEGAIDLDELCAAWNALDAIAKESGGNLSAFVAVDRAPTFGGEWPDDTHGVWSWDADRLLVDGSESSVEIVDR